METRSQICILGEGYVRGEENDQISPGMEDHIKKKAEGYSSRRLYYSDKMNVG